MFIGQSYCTANQELISWELTSQALGQIPHFWAAPLHCYAVTAEMRNGCNGDFAAERLSPGMVPQAPGARLPYVVQDPIVANLPSPSVTGKMHPRAGVQLDIIVVGAGLSGLAASIAAALSGHYVTVIESAQELREVSRYLIDICYESQKTDTDSRLKVGAGLQVTPNSSRILKRWDVSERLWRSVAEPTSLTVHRYSGKILAHEPEFNKKILYKYKSPFIDVHRVDLQLSLYDRARELGVQFKLGEKVSNIDFSVPEVITESGLKTKADLIIAADGLWSQCRACAFGRSDPPRPTGDLAYRLVIDLDQISEPKLRDWVSNPTVHFWIGPGSHAVGYSLRAGKQYNIVLLVPDDLPEGVSKQPGSVEEMKALFKGWDPTLSRFLDMVDHVDKWRLMHSVSPYGSSSQMIQSLNTDDIDLSS